MILKRRPDIERFIANPGRDIRAALLHGRDLGVVRERAAALAAKVTQRPDDPFDVALVSEADLDANPGRLVDELAAISMMGGRRLVRLRLSDDRSGPDRLAASALTEHLSGALNPEAFFLLECGALGRDSTLKKLAEKSEACAVIPCYEDEAGDIARFTREALSNDRLSLSADAMEVFVSRLPHERGVARQEIERLALFLGPNSGVNAGAADLVDFLGVEPEASLADAANDAFGGRLAAARAGLGRAAREGQAGPPAVRAMGVHLARVRRIITLTAGGATLQEAIKRADVFWKSEREISRQSRLWSLAELEKVQGEILAADITCKQTGSPDELIAERLALTIAGRARRLGL
jgi:DNA polymerase-3 subunit delta